MTTATIDAKSSKSVHASGSPPTAARQVDEATVPSPKSNQPKIKRRKDESIETLRGLAIFLVVASHVVLDPKNPVFTEWPRVQSALQHFFISVWPIRFPLFIVISGFVYAMRPIGQERLTDFLRGKSRRVLLPFVTMTMLLFGLKTMWLTLGEAAKAGSMGASLVTLAEGAWLSLSLGGHAILYPFAHLWFLPAIFLCLVTAAILDRLGWIDSLGKLLFWLAAWSIASLFLVRDEHLGASGLIFYTKYPYAMPFVLLGIALYRYPHILSRWPLTCAALAWCVVGITTQQLAMFDVIDFTTGRHGPLEITICLAGDLLAFNLRPTFKSLANLGHYAYAIYLFHFLFIAIGVRFDRALGLPDPIDFAVRLGLGIGGPIFLERMLRYSPRWRLLLLGMK